MIKIDKLLVLSLILLLNAPLAFAHKNLGNEQDATSEEDAKPKERRRRKAFTQEEILSDLREEEAQHKSHDRKRRGAETDEGKFIVEGHKPEEHYKKKASIPKDLDCPERISLTQLKSLLKPGKDRVLSKHNGIKTLTLNTVEIGEFDVRLAEAADGDRIPKLRDGVLKILEDEGGKLELISKEIIGSRKFLCTYNIEGKRGKSTEVRVTMTPIDEEE